MKAKIVVFLLTVGAFVITGCAGTQTAVNRFGNALPTVNPGVIESEITPVFFPKLGFNDFQPGLLTTSSGPQYNLGTLTLPLFKDTQFTQKPLGVIFPYNKDASLTLFRYNNFQFKLVPMINGAY